MNIGKAIFPSRNIHPCPASGLFHTITNTHRNVSHYNITCESAESEFRLNAFVTTSVCF